jgi:hypothetical protein
VAKNKDIDFEVIKSMSEEQQQQIYYTLAKRANQRFRDIENKAGLSSGAINKARNFLHENYNRDTFKQSKQLTGVELKENLKALESFYNAKTSTAKGIRQVQKERVKQFHEKGVEIKDTKKFFQFLSSQQFKTLSKYADSDQIIEDFTSADSEGFSLDTIMQGYEEFLNSDMTFEQVSERRHNGGELLH